MTQARAAGGHAMVAARELSGASRFAAYAAGQAAVVAHVAAHELGTAAYAIKAAQAAAPIGYSFANTADGSKLLFADGIFCEFTIFEEEELQSAVFSPGRVVWKAGGVSEKIGSPQRSREPKHQPSTEWLLGEALTNLYVGLSRDRRGEKLSAMRFIQGFTVDRILELSEKTEPINIAGGDEFNIERRFEQRHPGLAGHLPEFLQGYEKNWDSSLAVLSYLDANFEINPAMKQALTRLLE